MDNLLYNTLLKYFNILSLMGYRNYNSVYKILTLIFIYDFIKKDFYGYLTKEDYNTINKSLYCLFGTDCLIPIPTDNKLCFGNITKIV